jgi:uncharacterized protein with von Willebrand factor type A (vWA) domain
LALHRLAQRRSLCYRQKRNEPVQSGPIVIEVDSSGSMDGQPIIAAKGLAMAMAWLASHQNRWVCLVDFGVATECKMLALPPKHRQQDELIDWLLHQFGGGTELTTPLQTVPGMWPSLVGQGMSRGKTDHVIITDACVRAPDSMKDSYRQWAKDEKVRTFGIVIGAHEPGDLAEVSDVYWCIDEISMDSSAVESVLSI